MIDLTKIPSRARGYSAEQIDGELLLYHSERTTVVYLNRTAFMIWQLCDGQRTASDVATLLAAAFPGDHDAVARDVTQTMAHLMTHGVLTLA